MTNENQTEEKREDLINDLIATEAEAPAQATETAVEDTSKPKKKGKKDKTNKLFQKFTIKDIVFMAIMTACMLLTGGVMPLVIHVPVFGIIHMALGIQCSLFPTIAMLKVRKPGTLFLMCVFFGLPLCAFQPIMCVGCILCGFLTEVIALLIFRGYQKDIANIFAGALFFPISLPLMYLYYSFMYSGEAKGEAVQAYVGSDPGVAVGISFAVIAICTLGAVLGAVIFKELRKAGVIKK